MGRDIVTVLPRAAEVGNTPNEPGAGDGDTPGYVFGIGGAESPGLNGGAAYMKLPDGSMFILGLSRTVSHSEHSARGLWARLTREDLVSSPFYLPLSTKLVF